MNGENQVADRVREVLAQVLGLRHEEVGPGFRMESAVNWTSINHLMLVSQLESEFGVVFSNQQIRDLGSYHDIVELLGQRLDAPA